MLLVSKEGQFLYTYLLLTLGFINKPSEFIQGSYIYWQTIFEGSLKKKRTDIKMTI